MTTRTGADNCSECRFWRQDPDAQIEGERRDESFGWCRRNPPLVLDHMARMTIPHLGNSKDNYDPENVATAVNVHNATIFPATYGTGWCGEYQPENELPIC